MAGIEDRVENVANQANANKAAFGDNGFRVLAASSSSVAGEKFRTIVPASGDMIISATFAEGDDLTTHTTDKAVYGVCEDIVVAVGSSTVLAYLASKQ